MGRFTAPLTPAPAEPTASDARPTRTVRLLRAFTVVVSVIIVAVAVAIAVPVLRERAETARTTARFDPPVLAGQLVPGPCSNGGFHARLGEQVVLTMAAHCGIALPGTPMHGEDGRLVGTFGRSAELPDCPAERVCAPSDIVWLELAQDRIPWGHLNLVDMGAGGYRTIAPGTRPLSCADVHEGDAVEINGREHYRTGKILAVGPYEYTTDTMFPCMVITDVAGFHGDSGAPAMVNGLPAGSASRVIGGYLAFTPLAEGLENLGLVLCTTPDCDLSPAAAR
jgi:hypothetical protein